MFDLTSPATIQNILKKYNLSPNKILGQNFLVDKKVLDKIIETAEIKKGDNALEIGPGLGALTEALCGARANTVAIEKDKGLIPVLEDNLKDCKSLKILNGDFLRIDFEKMKSAFLEIPQNVIARTRLLAGTKQSLGSNMSAGIARDDRKNGDFQYKVISNIPYYITSPVIRKIFSFPIKPAEIIFLVQREVAERISAPPGKMSFISVFARFYGTPKIIEIVKPSSFWPAPEVDSAILKITVDKQQKLSGEETKNLWRLVKIGFSSRRKTLANNLAAGFRLKPAEVREKLKSLGFGEMARAQELDVKDWMKLLKKIY